MGGGTSLDGCGEGEFWGNVVLSSLGRWTAFGRAEGLEGRGMLIFLIEIGIRKSKERNFVVSCGEWGEELRSRRSGRGVSTGNFLAWGGRSGTQVRQRDG